ncbi:MAG: TonB-dependent receptor [Bacteroidetes bacterium]|nr:TonB-dependent receptor [Bacteroidota bacterium]
MEELCRFVLLHAHATNFIHSKKMRILTTIISFLLLSACPMLAQNENSNQSSTKDQVQLEEVTVTSSRIATPVAQTSKSVTIITKEQIQKAQVTSILDLLEYAANIDVLQRSPHGAQADISLRGGNFNQTAVLVDGVNLSNAQTGHYSFDIPVNISDIERIEVVNGPSALIYGASAFSGGVNIITKKEVTEKGYVNVGSGMHNLKSIEARGSLKTGIASHSLSVSQNESDGYKKNTDYNIYNLFWQTRFKLKNSNKLDIQLGYNDKNYGANSFYTAAFPNQYEYTSTYSATVKGEFGSRLKFIPIAYWTRHTDQFDLIKDSVYGRNYHRGDTYGANLIFQYKSKLGVTNWGGEVRKEDMLSSKLGKAMVNPHGKYTAYIDRVNTSLTLEHSLTIDKVSLEAGGLFNHNSFAGGTSGFYPSASVGYNPSGSFKIASSWSKSVRMPTYTELYYNTATHVANENLLPEKSESTELLFRYRHSFIELDVTGFLLWGRNIIDWIKETSSSKPTATNITKVNTQGVESNLRFRLSSLTSVLGDNASLALGYTRMWQDYDAQNYISESQNKLNYLRDKFTAQFSHRVYKDFSASWFFRIQKRMGTYTLYENNVSTGNQVGYPGFSTLDLKLDYKYENLRLNLSFNNLYNTKYVDLGNIEQPGFWLLGGISYVFK